MGQSSSKKKGKASISSSSVSGNPNLENKKPTRGGIVGGSNFPDPRIGSLRNTPNMNPMGTPLAETLEAAESLGSGGIHDQVMGGSNFLDPGISSLRNTPTMNPMGTPHAETLGGATTRAIPPNIVGNPALYQPYSSVQPRPFPSVMDNSGPSGT